MNRLFVVLAAIICFPFVLSAEKRYVIKTLTTNGSRYYDLNNFDEVAFSGTNSQGKYHIFLYTNKSLIQVTEDYAYTWYYYSLDLNDKGNIVFTMYSNEGTPNEKYIIKLKWAGLVYTAKNNLYWNYEIFPRINDSTTVVWHGIPGYGIQPEVYKITQKAEGNLSNSTNNPDIAPMINNNGWVTWYGDNRNQNQWSNRIRYIRPGDASFSEIPIMDASFPKIDDRNNILFPVNVSGKGYSNLYLFNSNNSTKIGDSVYVESSLGYDISNGKVVYSKGRSGSYSICMYDSTGTSVISLPGNDNYHPKINKNGMAVWRNSKNEVFVHRDGKTLKVGTDGAQPPLINDNGTIAWAGAAIGLYGNDIYFGEYKDVFDVTGKVVLQNGNSLSGVNVISGSTLLATTGADGSFSCLNLDPGPVTLSFSKSGYIFDPVSFNFNLNQHVKITPDIVARLASGIDDNNTTGKLDVFPNPATDKLKVRISGAYFDISEISLKDIHGAVIKMISFRNLSPGMNNIREIDVSDLPPGSYFLSTHEKGNVINKMFTIVR